VQFLGFLFSQVVQKHNLGADGKIMPRLIAYFLSNIFAKIINIGSCV